MKINLKGYTEKQWGEMHRTSSIYHKTFTCRYTYDNNYFYDTYQGIPIGGYTGIFEEC